MTLKKGAKKADKLRAGARGFFMQKYIYQQSRKLKKI